MNSATRNTYESTDHGTTRPKETPASSAAPRLPTFGRSRKPAEPRPRRIRFHAVPLHRRTDELGTAWRTVVCLRQPRAVGIAGDQESARVSRDERFMRAHQEGNLARAPCRPLPPNSGSRRCCCRTAGRPRPHTPFRSSPPNDFRSVRASPSHDRCQGWSVRPPWRGKAENGNPPCRRDAQHHTATLGSPRPFPRRSKDERCRVGRRPLPREKERLPTVQR